MKLKPQQVDKLHANYFIHNLFGPNANRRHNKFKGLFEFQNHMIKPPPKKKFQFWGCSLFLFQWNLYFHSLNAWCRLFHRWNDHAFQRSPCGQKLLCKKKKVMDYRHMLFIRNNTHIKYLCAMILLLPLHTRVMAFFDTVEGKHHQCAMYNLCKSGGFFKAAYKH